jgi:hypothetical protein
MGTYARRFAHRPETGLVLFSHRRGVRSCQTVRVGVMAEKQELSNDDLVIGPLTIWGEGRGESYVGKKAIAWVMRNRAEYALAYMQRNNGREYKLFGDGTIASVCLVPWQFSCWNKLDPNREKMLGMLVDRDETNPRWTAAATRDGALSDCITALLSVMREEASADKTYGATHYYDTRMPYTPTWAEGKHPSYVIGHHAFFNNVDHVDNPSYEWNAPYLDSSS